MWRKHRKASWTFFWLLDLTPPNTVLYECGMQEAKVDLLVHNHHQWTGVRVGRRTANFLSALCFTGGLRGSRGRSPLVRFHWSIVVPGELPMWRCSCGSFGQVTNKWRRMGRPRKALDRPLSTWGVWWLRCPPSLGQSHSWSNPRFEPEVS